jgi:hypothetical protein
MRSVSRVHRPHSANTTSISITAAAMRHARGAEIPRPADWPGLQETGQSRQNAATMQVDVNRHRSCHMHERILNLKTSIYAIREPCIARLAGHGLRHACPPEFESPHSQLLVYSCNTSIKVCLRGSYPQISFFFLYTQSRRFWCSGGGCNIFLRAPSNWFPFSIFGASPLKK